MKKGLSYVALILILTSTILLPNSVLASPAIDVPFECNGTINYIEPTIIGENVFPLPDGAWLVDDRQITGTFDSGTITGPFTVTYDAIIESALTQAGTFAGIISTWDDENDQIRVFDIAGELHPVEIVTEGPLTGLPRITFDGQWSFINNTKIYGNGDLVAWLIFIPEWIDGIPHVGTIVASSFTLTGLCYNQNDDDQ